MKPESKRRVASYTVREIREAWWDLWSLWLEMSCNTLVLSDNELIEQLRKNRAKKKGMKV